MTRVQPTDHGKNATTTLSPTNDPALMAELKRKLTSVGLYRKGMKLEEMRLAHQQALNENKY